MYIKIVVIDKFLIFVLMTKSNTKLRISVIFQIKVHQPLDKFVKNTNYYAQL